MADQQKYKVTERIDAGGMAEVFRGVAESIQGFKKAVAIKRILPNLTRKPKFVAMFLDEAKLSLHLQHANIVQVFDIGVADNTYFIVMEYIDGGNLRTLLDSLRRQGRRMKIEHTIYLMMEVCKGLAYAHDMHDPESGRPLGIVHRDISPPNILISRQGEVKLVDFGLAKAASQVENTEPGVVKGKFSYLSPEAAEGREVDHRSDIFAAGIVLFELLAGRRLFYGDTDYDTVQLVRQARIPSLKSLNPEVETQLEEVVRKALARDVVDRYQHGADLQDALAQYLFSRGMKVTSRDIAQLVQQCLKEKERSAPPKPKVSNIIDALIAEEIVKFTSLGEGDVDVEAPDGSRPLRPDDISEPPPLTDADTVDPRSWLDDLDTGKPGVEPIAQPPSRQARTSSHSAPAASQPGRGKTAPQGSPTARPAPEGKPVKTFRQFAVLAADDAPAAKAAPAPPAAPSAKAGKAPAPPAGAQARTGRTATQASVPVAAEAPPRKAVSAPRVATPIQAKGKAAAQGKKKGTEADLLEAMVDRPAKAGTRRYGAPAPEPDRTPPKSSKKWVVILVVVLLLALLGVAATLAYKVGLIGGGGAAVSPTTRTRGSGASRGPRRRIRRRGPA
ncbi:MAG: protein kinase [Deltaproteobacteria bacterium]|nr:protein kinase [Deltaproteobacteria bacterium]